MVLEDIISRAHAVAITSICFCRYLVWEVKLSSLLETSDIIWCRFSCSACADLRVGLSTCIILNRTYEWSWINFRLKKEACWFKSQQYTKFPVSWNSQMGDLFILLFLQALTCCMYSGITYTVLHYNNIMASLWARGSFSVHFTYITITTIINILSYFVTEFLHQEREC